MAFVSEIIARPRIMLDAKRNINYAKALTIIAWRESTTLARARGPSDPWIWLRLAQLCLSRRDYLSTVEQCRNARFFLRAPRRIKTFGEPEPRLYVIASRGRRVALFVPRTAKRIPSFFSLMSDLPTYRRVS